MSRERLGEIKELWESDNQYCDPSTYEWLIEQAELGIGYDEKYIELHKVLDKVLDNNVDILDVKDYWGLNVVDVAIKIINKQAERVQELEEFKESAERMYKNYHLSAKRSDEEKEKLRNENKRLRKALVNARHEITSSLSLDVEGLNAIEIIDQALEVDHERG